MGIGTAAIDLDSVVVKPVESLLADDRERKIIPLLEAMGLPVQKQRLKVSDYWWLDKGGSLVLVSRKASDLLASLRSKHLQDEFTRCHEAISQHKWGGRLFWLWEGVWAEAEERGVRGCGYYTQETFRGNFILRTRPSKFSPVVLAGLQTSATAAGISILWSAGPTATATLLGNLYRRSQAGWPTTIVGGKDK